MYGKTIECGGMICEREMSLAGDGKQLKKVMTECPMVENSKERKQLQETSAARTNPFTVARGDKTAMRPLPIYLGHLSVIFLG